jgi:hypothetical protein
MGASSCLVLSIDPAKVSEGERPFNGHLPAGAGGSP